MIPFLTIIIDKDIALKNLFIIFLILGLLFGCTSPPSGKQNALVSWMEGNGKIKVLSSVEMVSDLVRGIGKEHIENLTLVQGELDPHSYELVKGDDEKLRRADIIFYVGIGLEHGATLSQALQGNPKAVGVGDWILKNHPHRILSIDSVVDPHIWMDISLWLMAIEPITEALVQLDPHHESDYNKNARELSEKLNTAHNVLLRKLAQIPKEKRYLVTSHDAFHYFGRTYFAEEDEKGESSEWIKRVQAPEGLAPESQLSTADIKSIVEHLKLHNIRVIFSESNVSQDSIKKIVDACRKMGIYVEIAKEPLYGDAMKSNMEGKEMGYLETLFHNADVLMRNLKK